MATLNSLIVFSVVIYTIGIIFSCVFADDKKVYIVYMGALPSGDYSPLVHHESILQEVLENSLPSDALIHSYKRSFNGFAANLTDNERQKISNMEGILSVFPSRTIKLQTTRSWDFIGFKENVKRVPMVESDVIVGMLDTGICPEAESFSDEGFGPPPKKWKGTCNGGNNFKCNNKLIGARFYDSYKLKAHNSARDTNGHGTHTASTAAGNQVNSVSFEGLAQGNARGAVPSARIAVYKVCWDDQCGDSDILAAFDDAISDGVDILSVSLGNDDAVQYHLDSIAIGAFHAMQKGILTSQSGGNNGPGRSTVTSVAPWKLSVAASSTDRQIIDKVILGDDATLVGRAINSFDMKGKKHPLTKPVYPLSSCDNRTARLCAEHLSDNSPIEGKIVFYDYYTQGGQDLQNKAAGMIVESEQLNDFSQLYPLPASLLNIKDGERIRSYIHNTKNPVATILKAEELKNANAPVVVSFSSRGPNPITRAILKPDISAPGVEILAAWPQALSATGIFGDKRFLKYNFLSGTSMACPHATGAAAYVKSFHPDWSPSAIKSALMTTAFPMNSTTNPDAEFAYGAGHIDPVKAVNPGLVYDALEEDYIELLCNIGYTKDQIKLLSGRNSSCSKHSRGSPRDLNYPTMLSDVPKANFTRKVTNVGVANSTYRATIKSPSNLKISVEPKVLSFKSLNEKQSFLVMVSTTAPKENSIVSASVVWSDGVHTVHSPIVLYLESNATVSQQ